MEEDGGGLRRMEDDGEGWSRMEEQNKGMDENRPAPLFRSTGLLSYSEDPRSKNRLRLPAPRLSLHTFFKTRYERSYW